MIDRLSKTLLGAIVIMVAGALGAPTDATAQRAGASAPPQQETRRVPAMRERVMNPLSEAQECAEAGDYQCARRHLNRVQQMNDLNGYERAQMWNFFAFIYVNEENFTEAIRAYENVLGEEEIPEGLETNTMNTLAMLYYQEERYEDALEMIDRWLAVTENPRADSFILKATIYYQLRQYRAGIPEVERALQIAASRGDEPQESWYQLLQVFYYELEDWPNLIQTLRTMVEKWPKREYLVTLAGIYGQQGEEARQLALFETAYEAGWLNRGSDLVALANMLLQADIPYKAAQILQRGLDEGTIDSTESNWRTLSQALTMAQEHEASIPALRRAADMSQDGNLDFQLAQSFQNLTRWEECVDATREALRKGGLRRTDQTNLVLGICLLEQRRYDDAEQAFLAAQRDERSRQSASQWLSFLRGERDRERQIEQALAQARR